MAQVFYILQSLANLISLAKLNNVGLYWDNKTWNSYDITEIGNIVGYMSKWRQNWVFQIWDINIKDIAVGITKIGSDIYQWPMDTPLSAFSISHSISEKLSVWHSRIGHLSFTTFRKYLT